MAFAYALVKNGFNVDLEWNNPDITTILGDRFGMNLDAVNVVNDVKRGDGYDLCFWVSDGSIPMLHARNNILHFQVPFHDVKGGSLINKMKLFRVNNIICNSQFTKRIIDKEYGVESVVIYPPVNTTDIKPKRKENIILFVGRFSQILQNKGQDVLIRAFRKMYDGGLKNWKLIIAGGIGVGVDDFVNKLCSMAQGYPIQVITSPDFKTLRNLYGISKIFWSASGYNENEAKNPEKVEHFGITVIEAMAGEAVPVVYAAGGHKETIVSGENGLLWTNTTSLIKKTHDLVEDPKLLRKIGLNARKSADKFSVMSFEKQVESIILQR